MPLKIKPKNPERVNRLDYSDKNAALILRRRLQVLVHSYLYYQRNTNLISDKQFDEIAKELVVLQEKYPDTASKVSYADAFKGFDGTTGFDLPYKDLRIRGIAEHLIYINEHLEKKSRRFGG